MKSALPHSHQTTCLVRLAGGLGNQLFQFAAAVNLAQWCEFSYSNIIIDTRFLESYETKHEFEIQFMRNFFPGVQVTSNIPFIAALASRFRIAKMVDGAFGKNIFISSVQQLKTQRLCRIEPSLIVLDGYFQDPSIIFSEYERNRIRSALLEKKIALVEKITQREPAIGVHIRRGDYLTSKSAAKVFRNIPLSYYDFALAQLTYHSKVLVFSDDRHLSALFANKVNGIDIRRLNLSLEEEFCLLMSCKTHVIGNSTFSWWAAYLGHELGGRVFAPKNWYHDELRNRANPLLLPHFELIDE